MSVVALVPAKDRADTIAATVAAVRTVAGIDEVIVVDDGSSDATTQRALDAGATVVRLERNLGKGGAIRAGIGAAPAAEIYVLVDADLGASAVAVEALVDAVAAGDADLAVGILPPAGGRGGFGLIKRRARQGVARACGFAPVEPLSGQRAIRGELLRGIQLADRFGIEVGMTIDAVRAGARVVELPVEIEHRHTGRKLAGFRHRARQGLDIARALWPRLTTARQRIALITASAIVAVALMLVSGSQWQPAAVPLDSPTENVVIFGFTHLSFDDLADTPNLRRLMQQGAVGAMNVRTSSARPATHEAYASLGAGVRLRAVPQLAAATDAARGVQVSGAALARREVEGDHLSSDPGALGDALGRAGLSAGAVGNADGDRRRRPAAAAVMDHLGLVDTGTVSPGWLLEPAPAFPFARRASAGGMATATLDSLKTAAVVMVDPGDMERAARAGVSLAGARRHTDEVLGLLADRLPPATVLIVIAPVPPAARWRLTPFVVVGDSVPHGYAQSPSTKREGLATITDVAPTVLDALGLKRDADMVGSAVRYRPGEIDLESLQRLDRESRQREASYSPVGVIFVLGAIALYLVVLLVVRRGRRQRRLSPRSGRAVGLLVLASAAFPLATFAHRALPGTADSGAAAFPVIGVLCLLIALVTGRARRHPLAPLGWILFLTAAVVVGDVATGSRLHASGFLGYPLPSAAGRFHGLTNTTFAVLGACLLLGMAMHVAYSPRRREALVTAGAMAAVVVVGDGAPTIGNDVGGIITLVPSAGLLLWLLAGRRVSWRVMLGIGGLLGAALALATGIDLARAPESRSHLGNFAADVGNDPGLLLTTAQRKIEANFRVFVELPWTWVLPGASAVMLYLLLRRVIWTDFLPQDSPLRTGVVLTFVAGVVGFLVNDSGPIVIAMFLLFIAAFVALLALTFSPPPLRLESALPPRVHPPSLEADKSVGSQR